MNIENLEKVTQITERIKTLREKLKQYTGANEVVIKQHNSVVQTIVTDNNSEHPQKEIAKKFMDEIRQDLEAKIKAEEENLLPL